MELLHERCAALDIGKKDLKACVRTPSVSRRKRSRSQEIRTYATTTNALLEVRDWLVAERVSLVVLEATGDYWRGAFYLLEDDLNVILVTRRQDPTSPTPTTQPGSLPESPGAVACSLAYHGHRSPQVIFGSVSAGIWRIGTPARRTPFPRLAGPWIWPSVRRTCS